MESMDCITYNLRENGNNSDKFYEHLNSFSQKVYEKLNDEVGNIISEYIEFVNSQKIELPRTNQEYSIEILTFAMTLQRYYSPSKKNSLILLNFLKYLYSVRKRSEKFKKVVDPIRGFITGKFIFPKINKNYFGHSINLKALSKLILWLEATGEFEDEVKRFKNWFLFFEDKSTKEIETMFDSFGNVFNWFKVEAKNELGKYSSCVKFFLKNEHKNYKWREDAIFCGKEEVEYHINMVASEIINWGFKEDFLKTEKRVVLVPACMHYNNGEDCTAQIDGDDISCVGCTSDCFVNLIRESGEENNFKVFIVPHSSSFRRWLKRWENTNIRSSCCRLFT